MKLTFITGGARSGKSSFAEKMATNLGQTIYIATAQALDDEMAYRVKLHQERRPKNWITFEETKYVSKVLKDIRNKKDTFLDFKGILIDCLALLVSNWLMDVDVNDVKTWGKARRKLLEEIDNITCLAKDLPWQIIIVSNEVGLGLVPDYPLGRLYRDLLGEVNQKVAKAADQFYFLVSGIPIKIK